MKRYICLLLTFAIIGFGRAWAEGYQDDIKVIAAGQNDGIWLTVCEHEYLIYGQAGPYAEGYESCGSINHACFKYYQGACRYCGSQGTVVIWGSTQQHEWVYKNNHCHVVGQNKHEYMFECGVCNAAMSEFYPCPGTGHGDCVIIMPDVNK